MGPIPKVSLLLPYRGEVHHGLMDDQRTPIKLYPSYILRFPSPFPPVPSHFPPHLERSNSATGSAEPAGKSSVPPIHGRRVVEQHLSPEPWRVGVLGRAARGRHGPGGLWLGYLPHRSHRRVDELHNLPGPLQELHASASVRCRLVARRYTRGLDASLLVS